MDYLTEYANKIANAEKLQKENEELKRRLAEAEQRPALNIESEVVKAFRESPEYLSLELQAFNSFLQDKFIKEFQRSPQAEQLVKVAQERFKKFEENYNSNKKKGAKKDEKEPDA